jgi:hypothetical protein
MAARQFLWQDAERSLKILDGIGGKEGEVANIARGIARDWRENRIQPDKQ